MDRPRCAGPRRLWSGPRAAPGHGTFTSDTGAPGAPHPGTLIGVDPLGTWRAARDASVPMLTWDIGRPAGLDVRLDPELVPACFAWSRTMALRFPGGIGPEAAPQSDADEQTCFLAYLGRGEETLPAA